MTAPEPKDLAGMTRPELERYARDLELTTALQDEAAQKAQVQMMKAYLRIKGLETKTQNT